ncbi:DUF1616 domain-containing protein [Halobium salinum]|uniref:DUF1616 domain-containing protein n=1 Tax=Halobium salinum TaxID=1364940 RepID=A0ABD5PAL0_9EURY|nr:DUF1616 domain-containing protein [Halobium salinum]
MSESEHNADLGFSADTVPLDLVGTSVLALSGCFTVLLPVFEGTIVRALLGSLLVLFLPGYAIVAAAFPRKMFDPQPAEYEESWVFGFLPSTVSDRTFGVLGRVIVAIVLSITTAILTGVVLSFLGVGVRVAPLAEAITALVLVASLVAVGRRLQYPPEERFTLTTDRVVPVVSDFMHPGSRRELAVNVVVVVCLLTSVASVGYAIENVREPEPFTDFYLLSPNGSGEFTMDEYPTEFVEGEPTRLAVAIGNHEGGRTTYTVVGELQQVNGEERVVAEEEFWRTEAVVPANGTWQGTHNIVPTSTGDDVRVVYLLYRGEAPENPTRQNAYRTLDLHVSVTASNETALLDTVR